jgi:hypothetical protein
MCISYGNSNEYYYIYWEKKLSQNVNHIEAHNKNLSHFQFVKFQQKTTYLKQLSIVCFCFKFSFFCNCYTHDVFVFLSLTFVNKITKWGASRHYMICKTHNVYLPTCFEKIEKHVAKPKHAQNLQKQKLDNVVQKTCMFSNFCLIICMCFTC